MTKLVRFNEGQQAQAMDDLDVEPMVTFHNVFKRYKVSGGQKVILDHVSLQFEKGYNYGVLGINGAGKSTFMRMISGTELPTSGKVRRHCRVSWPLGFGGSLHPTMTGVDNIAFIADLYAQDRRKIRKFVEEFSEVGAYLEMPVGTYSSGMLQRVAFGLSMAVNFDLYLIDEVMAVGDARFQARCREEFDKRLESSSIVMISHDMNSILQYCDRCLVLENGKVHYFDEVERGIETYRLLNR